MNIKTKGVVKTAGSSKPAAKAEAEKVLAQVKAKPADFAALAKQYSKDPASADKGGNLGYVAKDGGLGEAFENSAFSLQKGQISDVVKTDYGYHIITVLNTQDAPVLAQEKTRLEAEIKQDNAWTFTRIFFDFFCRIHLDFVNR